MHKEQDQSISRTVQGLIWNYVSTIVLAVSGVLFNTIIMLFYDASVLGLFNQAYAWYIVLSQLTVFGIQASTGKYAAEYQNNREELNKLLGGALVSTFLIAMLICTLTEVFLLSIPMKRIGLVRSIKIIVMALPFFSMNKVILGFLNGILKMKQYAIFQTLRYIFIAIVLAALAFLNFDGDKITICFIIAEGALFFITVVYLRYVGIRLSNLSRKWVLCHLKFGIRIIPSNFVAELNTKADVICLGFLLKEDYLIGIYSYAVLFAEGFYQVYIVLRRNLNPMITRHYIYGDLVDYWNKIKMKIHNFFYAGSILAYLCLLMGYYIVCMLLRKEEYISGIYLVAIIGFSIVCNAKYIIMGNLFTQIGMPGTESYINVLTVLTNIILNILFVKAWGLSGAALATSVSYVFFSWMLSRSTRRMIGLKI